MNFGKLIYSFSPRITSRALALILSILITVGAVRIASAFTEKESYTGDGETVNDTITDVSDRTETDQKTNSEIDTDASLLIGAVIKGASAMIVDLAESKAAAVKNETAKREIKHAPAFVCAMVVSKAVSSGAVKLTDQAVCPASAAKCPDYEISEEVLPIGKRMAIGDILRCMFYQSGSSYAYTLAIHISGSEEAFVKEMNALADELGLRETLFVGCNEGTVSAYDLSVIMKYMLADPLLRGYFCSDDEVTVGYGQSGSVSLVVRNNFFESYCTESQAKSDGIIGGKVSEGGYDGWSAVLFSRNGKEYLVLIIGSGEAFADALMAFSAYVLAPEG